MWNPLEPAWNPEPFCHPAEAKLTVPMVHLLWNPLEPDREPACFEGSIKRNRRKRDCPAINIYY